MVAQNIKPDSGWRASSLKVASRFTDRCGESEALRQSLNVHRQAIDDGLIDGLVMNNMLVFYGVGGVGKTTLSETLEGWINGFVTGEGIHWNDSPRLSGLVTVRWDLRSNSELSGVMLFYIALRNALAAKGVKTLMFDLGLAAFHEKFNRGMTREDAKKVNLDIMQDVAENAVQDMLEVVGITATALGIGVGIQAISKLLVLVIEKLKYRKAAGIVDGFSEILASIRSGDDGIDHLRAAVAHVGYLLSCDIEQYSPQDRPMAVVFIDTFEYLSSPERRVSRNEEVVNAVLGNLPYCLFVITGREMVDWSNPDRTSLSFAGRGTWPSLACTNGDIEPRQHLIGMFDERDAFDLLTYCLANVDAPLEEGLVAELARTTRLPEHIDATVILAKRFATGNPGQVLTQNHLGGSFKDVVERLLEHLGAIEARALLAAAVAPAFDERLLQAIAEIRLGEAQRAVSSSLFFIQPGLPYFNRHLHDEIRRLLRYAGPEIKHAWAEDDWRMAAERGLNHLGERLQVTIREDLPEERMAIHVLGYRLCREYEIEADWVIEEFAQTPSRKKVARIIGPVDPSTGRLAEAAKLNEFIGVGKRNIGELAAFCNTISDHKLRHSAKRWLAYAHRDMHEYAEAERILRALWRDGMQTIDARQYVITLRMQRRYRDAVAAQQLMDPNSFLSLGGVAFAEGRLADARDIAEDRLAEAWAKGSSRRWIAELQGILVEYRAWLGVATDEELEGHRDLGVSLERLGSQRIAWQWLALRHIFDDAVVEEAWQALTEITATDGLPPIGVKRALLKIACMRTLGPGDDHYFWKLGDIRESLELGASNTDRLLLEYLCEKGRISESLPLLETQWTSPESEIRQRWRNIFDRLIEEARRRG